MSSTREGPESLPPQSGARAVATLSRDLADFLVEFSIVLHKRAMYPLGHPHLQESIERFVDRLEALLVPRDSLAIGVARHQLIVAGVATDPRNALLSDLARRLHRHRIATVRFERGLALLEIDDLLAGLAGDPHGDERPFGLRPNVGGEWSHLRVQPPELNRLFLHEDDDQEEEAETPGGALWLGLAHLALCGDGGTPADADDPLLVARAIDAPPQEVAYDRVVLDYLGQIADEMSGREGAWEPRVRERVSRLVSSLKPETLRRVLEAGADHAERRRFALTAAEVLAVDAVIEVVEAAASATGQTISHQLLRLLHKFAQHAEQGPERSRGEAESTLRRDVAQLVTGWDLEDPNPGSYTAVLDGMTRQSPDEAGAMEDRLDCEPEAVLHIALETDCGGPRVYAALETMLAERRLPAAVELLRAAPGSATATADALWRHLATPARLRVELSASRLDLGTIESLVRRLGQLATEPLLDVIERAADRGARARTLRLLRTWPPGFSAVPYARHSELRLRREAYKLLLEFPAHRTSAIVHGLEDERPEIVTLVLRAVVDGCPPDAMRAIERFAGDWRRPAELRAIAIRAVARGSGPQALARLLDLAGARRSFFGWRLEAASPVALAAVAALARHWGSHPQVVSLLKAARDHSDPEIRLAVQMGHA